MNPLIAYGLGAGTVLAWDNRERIRQAYGDIYAKAMASPDAKAVKKAAVAFGAVGYPVQASVLAARARQLGGGAAGTPNVLRFPDRMMPGEVLQPQISKQNQTVGLDPTGILTFQTDGNLVLYGPGQTVLWASNTAKKGISRLTMQSDGNLVIYGNDSKPKWASGTQGNAGAYLVVRGGTAQVIGPSGQPIWTAGAPGGAGAGVLPGMPGFPGAPGMLPGIPGFPGMGVRGHHHYAPGYGWQGPPGIGRRDEHHHHHHHHKDWQQQQQQQQQVAAPVAAPVATPMAAPVAAPSVDPSTYAASPSVATDDSGGVSDATLDDGDGGGGSYDGDGSGGVSDVSSIMSGFGAVGFGQGYFSAYQQAGGGLGGYGQQYPHHHRHHHHHHGQGQYGQGQYGQGQYGQGQYGQQSGYGQPPYGQGGGYGQPPYTPPPTGQIDPTTGLPIALPGSSGMFG